MNSRERQVRRGRKILTDQRFAAFLRAIRDQSDLLAVKLINADLDQGRSFDDIFYTDSDYGFVLSVKQTSTDCFDVQFGCQAGPTAGDGGRWRVTFQAETVAALEETECWIS